jgi:hypothetical protein
MEFSTEITIMGQVGATDIADKTRDAMAASIQQICNSDTIHMTNVKTMVMNVIARADGGKISRLNVLDHGTENGNCWFGTDYITADNFEKFGSFLARLSPYFTQSAIVHLGHCYLGTNEALLQMFAMTFGAAVIAGTGKDAGAPYNFNFGNYVRCSRSGMIYHNVNRP